MDALYNSFNSEESLVSYLEGKDVVAVRFNDEEVPDIDYLDGMEERNILDSSGETKAVAYLAPDAHEDAVVFGESEAIE